MRLLSNVKLNHSVMENKTYQEIEVNSTIMNFLNNDEPTIKEVIQHIIRFKQWSSELNVGELMSMHSEQLVHLIYEYYKSILYDKNIYAEVYTKNNTIQRRDYIKGFTIFFDTEMDMVCYDLFVTYSITVFNGILKKIGYNGELNSVTDSGEDEIMGKWSIRLYTPQ